MFTFTTATVIACSVLAQDALDQRGPLQRYEPRNYDVVFGVAMSIPYTQLDAQQRTYTLENSPIAMPLLSTSPFSDIESKSIKRTLLLANREVFPNSEVRDFTPFNTKLSIIYVDQFQGNSLQWSTRFSSKVWSCSINEQGAAQITWPKSWPKTVQDGLAPQPFIESDDPVFAKAVERITRGRIKQAPPYLAVKEIVRSCINDIQVSGSSEDRGEVGQIRGMNVNGALETIKSRSGSSHDLVCVCVAHLRAAGIPARAVIGIEEDARGRENFVSWAEFYLPQAEWIPFDPDEMRGKGIRNMDIFQPWPEFGTMKDLNRRIPLAYDFIPRATVESPGTVAIWGWDPRPGGDPGSQQAINISITSRGRADQN